MLGGFGFTDFFSLNYQMGLIVKQIGIAGGIFLTFLLLQKVFAKDLFRMLINLAKNTPTDLDEQLLLAFEKPLRWFFIFLGAYFALRYLPLSIEYDLLLAKLFRSSVIIVITVGIYNLVGNNAVIGSGIGNLFNIDLEEILIPFLSRTLKVIIFALGVSIIAGEWDYDVNGFVAGLGLGGLAFALAAKDAVANIFGGIIIITDKPFNIGDWIQTANLEGVVEDINFRSTRIRTFAQALITVPNANLANEPITNWSRMGIRRITFNLKLNYNTSQEKLERSVTAIRTMLKGHSEISQKTIFVRFDAFGESGFEIFLYFFTKTTAWGEFLKIKEDVNYRIIEILEKEGVSIALPSTSVYFASHSDEQADQQVESDFYR